MDFSTDISNLYRKTNTQQEEEKKTPVTSWAWQDACVFSPQGDRGRASGAPWRPATRPVSWLRNRARALPVRAAGVLSPSPLGSRLWIPGAVCTVMQIFIAVQWFNFQWYYWTIRILNLCAHGRISEWEEKKPFKREPLWATLLITQTFHWHQLYLFLSLHSRPH